MTVLISVPSCCLFSQVFLAIFFKVSGRHHGQDLQNNNVTAAAKAEFVVAAPAAAVVRGRGCAPRFVVVSFYS